MAQFMAGLQEATLLLRDPFTALLAPRVYMADP